MGIAAVPAIVVVVVVVVAATMVERGRAIFSALSFGTFGVEMMRESQTSHHHLSLLRVDATISLRREISWERRHSHKNCANILANNATKESRLIKGITLHSCDVTHVEHPTAQHCIRWYLKTFGVDRNRVTQIFIGPAIVAG
jgi:hypothetical protein